LTAENCLYGFWGLPQTLRPATPLGTSIPRPPVPILTSEPGYTTASDNDYSGIRQLTRYGVIFKDESQLYKVAGEAWAAWL